MVEKLAAEESEKKVDIEIEVGELEERMEEEL